MALVLVILPALGTKTQKSQWKGKTGSVIALVCQEMVVVVLAASVRWGEGEHEGLRVLCFQPCYGSCKKWGGEI